MWGGRAPEQTTATVTAHAPDRRATGTAVRSVACRVFDELAGVLAEERGRFVNWAPVAIGCGIAFYFAAPAEPALMGALSALAITLLVRRAVAGHWIAAALATFAILAAVGVNLAKLRSMWVAAPILDRGLTAVEVEGFIERLEPHAERGVRLTLRVTRLGDVAEDRQPLRARIRLLSSAEGLRPGDGVRLTASLRPPAGPALPGGYDFGRAAYFNSIGAVGYALRPPQRVAIAAAPPLDLAMAIPWQHVRMMIAQRITSVLPDERGALATALLTGERGGISEETTAAYRDSGLIHVLSISGLHMAIMAGSVFALLRLVLAAFPTVALMYPTKKWAAAGGAIAAMLYLGISGATAATIRSCVMMQVFFLAVMLGRPAIAMRNVAIAALVILAVWPESLLDAGFQMSFAAVVALVAAYEWAAQLARRWRWQPGPLMQVVAFLAGICFSTIVASGAVAPFSVYHFHASQQYAVLANLLAIPVCNLVVMPAALASLIAMPIGFEAAPLTIMALGLDAMGAVARWVAGLEGSVIRLGAISDIGFAACVLGGLWLTLWGTRWRLVGVVGIAAGLVLAPRVDRPDILVSRDGNLVAVRQSDGALSAVGGRAAAFELEHWLEWDGDGRTPGDVMRAGGIRCDELGCVSVARDLEVAISRHPAAAADDCRRADALVVVAGDVPSICPRPRIVIDKHDLRSEGAHAVYFGPEGAPQVVTAAQLRGRRPWSQPPQRTEMQPVSHRSDRLAWSAARPRTASDWGSKFQHGQAPSADELQLGSGAVDPVTHLSRIASFAQLAEPLAEHARLARISRHEVGQSGADLTGLSVWADAEFPESDE